MLIVVGPLNFWKLFMKGRILNGSASLASVISQASVYFFCDPSVHNSYLFVDSIVFKFCLCALAELQQFVHVVFFVESFLFHRGCQRNVGSQRIFVIETIPHSRGVCQYPMWNKNISKIGQNWVIMSSIGWGGGVTEHFRAPYCNMAFRRFYSISVEQFHGQSSVSHSSFCTDWTNMKFVWANFHSNS